MKKIYLGAALFACTISFAQNTVDFEDLSLPGSQTYWDGSDGSGGFTSNGIFFENVYNDAWGFWESGFAYSNQVSDTMTGLNGQYSSYADGGVGGSGNYVISQNNTWITGLASQNTQIMTIDISNSNYSAHSMLNGDQFAKKFGGSTGNDPDWFLLTVYAYYGSDTIPGDSLEVYLADYRFSDNSLDTILKNWTTIDLQTLNYAPEKLKFELTSSDVGTWGMNTPAFFCMDNMEIAALESVEENQIHFELYPNPASDALYIKADNGTYAYAIYSPDGKMIKNNQVTTNPISISDLPSGSYWIRLKGENGISTKSFIKY